MSYPFDPNGGPPHADSGASRPPHDAPPGQYPPYPPYPPYAEPPYPPSAGFSQPPAGYPAQPQGYPYPYGMYPPPYGPGYPPPQQLRQRNTTLWVILGVVGALVIVSCVGCGLILNLVGPAISRYVEPTITVTDFCDDEVSADYSAAYADLSPTLQASMTSDQFVAQSTARDATEGTVTSCGVDTAHGSGIVSSSSASATIDVTMTRSIAGTFVGSLRLINSGSAWTIDQIDPALPILTDGTPTDSGAATPTV